MPRPLMAAARHPRAFTLIELLVVIAVVAVLTAALLPALASARAEAGRVISANNMRTLGVALELYLDDNNQDYPATSHGNPDLSEAWVYTLAPYLDGARQIADPDDPTARIYTLGKVRVCPRDPKAEERLERGGTSYIMNEFVTVPQVGPFGQIDPNKSYTNRRRLDHPSRVPTVFIAAPDMGVDATNDHAHSRTWTDFGWDAVLDDIDPARFGGDGDRGLGGDSLYLYADNHLETRPGREIKSLIDDGINFAEPNRQ